MDHEAATVPEPMCLSALITMAERHLQHFGDGPVKVRVYAPDRLTMLHKAYLSGAWHVAHSLEEGSEVAVDQLRAPGDGAANDATNDAVEDLQFELYVDTNDLCQMIPSQRHFSDEHESAAR